MALFDRGSCHLFLVWGCALTAAACLRPTRTTALEPAGKGCDPAKPIVSLTYDDSLPTQLAAVAPALQAHHLRATFFVTDVTSNPAPWAALKAAGHELGAHTFQHPCPRSNSWVQPANASEAYTLARMAQELDAGVAELRNLGQTSPFSFAYPCGVAWVGEDQESYLGLVRQRFAGARGVVPGVVTSLSDPYDVPATFSTGSGAELQRVVDQARAQQGWVVFGFHGVGGDSNAIAAEAHEHLLAYLDEQGHAVQVLPFGEALGCMAAR